MPKSWPLGDEDQELVLRTVQKFRVKTVAQRAALSEVAVLRAAVGEDVLSGTAQVLLEVCRTLQEEAMQDGTSPSPKRRVDSGGDHDPVRSKKGARSTR